MKWVYYDGEIGEICKVDITKKEFFYKIRYLIGFITLAFILTIIITKVIFMNTKVPTRSMENIITSGDMVLGNRLAYKNNDPERGDIIIFKYPDNPKIQYIKRVIGLPGETVNIIDGVVFVDNMKIDELYLSCTPNDTCGPFTVPEDSYFVLGDNRNASEDSRSWKNKYVKSDQILAKAMFTYWPEVKKLK